MNVPPLITYPARPIQGGPLELAPPKRGLWYAEPKLNGWRALIHMPSGTMWNRHGVECEEFSKKKAGHGKEGSKQATQTKKQP